jgi:hypothetical protein
MAWITLKTWVIGNKLDLRCADLQFSLFCQLYTASLAIHYTKRWNEPEIATLAMACLVLCVFTREKLQWASAISLVVIYAEIKGFPRIANHATLMLFVSLAFCFSLVVCGVRSRPFPIKLFKNGLRGIAVVLYFFVGFHKINTGFLDPEYSCATWFHSRIETEILNGAYQIPQFVITWSPTYVIVAEILVAALLIFQRTWLLALILALPIHLYVSLSGFTDFSSFMHAIMILFIPDWFWRELKATRWKRKLVTRSIRIYGLGIMVYSVFSIFALNVWYINYWDAELVKGIILNLLVLEFCLIVFLVWRSGRSRENTIQSWPDWHSWHSVPIVLVFFWGAFPYLFGSQGSLTMFSNLVTERDRANHLILDPTWTKIVDFEQDLIFVRGFDSTNRIQSRGDLQGYLLPESEWRWSVYRAALNSDVPIGVTIEVDGKRQHLKDVVNSEYSTPLMISYFLSFRKVDPIGSAKCRW